MNPSRRRSKSAGRAPESPHARAAHVAALRRAYEQGHLDLTVFEDDPAFVRLLADLADR